MKRILTIVLILFCTNVLLAQLNNPPAAKPRQADFEYLSAPDSTGHRTPLKTANVSRSQQLKLPYPIIFIHGLESNSDTWNTATTWMDGQYNLTFGGRLDFCLNFDANNSIANTNFYPTAGADLALFSSTLVDGDYYYLNFDVGTDGSFSPSSWSGAYVKSNQSAITKQGLALKWAIYFVLQQTGRDKVVLMGHSMGGLASRQYLQNPAFWQPEGQSHVAKLVTTGTPHGGSNTTTAGILYWPDGQSEAVRDLRRDYYYSGNPGVFLFGGIENLSSMDDQFCCYFYNADVNCNGVGNTNESITGLNQRSIYTNLDYSCIIGECSGCIIDLSAGDGVVNDYSANLNNFYTNIANVFYYNASAVTQIHTDLPSQSYQNMEGLDEPNEYNLSYGINFDTAYTGFTTIQPAGSYPYDYDDYKFTVSANSTVNVSINNIALADLMVRILDSQYNTIGTVVHSSGASVINLSQILCTGTYYIEIYGTPTTTSYLSPYDFVVTQSLLPNVTVNSPTICAGQTANLTANGAVSYSWSAGATSTGVNTSNATPAVTATYTVTGNTGGCSTTSISTVTVIPLPSVTVTSVGICEGQSALLTANGAASYDWSAGVTATGVNTASASPSLTTTYTVTGTANSCSASATALVTVTPNPSVSVNSPTICFGQVATLTANGAASYTWSAGPTQIGVNTSTVSPAVNATYTVTGTASGCSNTAVSVVTVNSLPPVTVSSDTICSGQIALLTANGAATYSWSNGATSSGVNTANASPITSSTYTVTGTTSGCSNTAVAMVNVNPSPSVTVNSTTICEGQTVNLIANGANSYTWSSGATVTGSNTASVAPLVTTTYTVTGTLGACMGSAVSTITVNSVPIVTVNSDSICQGEFVSLVATGAVTFVWIPATGLNNVSIANPTANPSTTIIYTVTGTASGCSAMALSTVSVTPLPPTPIITQNGFVLTSSSVSSNQWYWNGTLITGATGQTYTVTQNGNYSVIVLDNGCYSLSSADANVLMTAVEESAGNSISIYPNPFNSQTMVLSGIEQNHAILRISDVLGKEIKSIRFSGKECIIEKGDMQAGVYFVEIAGSAGEKTRIKMIVN